MSNRKLILDTCAILWILLDKDKLSKNAISTLSQSDLEIKIVSVSIGEIACACEREKLILDSHWKLWIREVLSKTNWQVVDVSQKIIEEAYSLPDTFHSDPVDRIIVAATRLEIDSYLITGDRKILDYAHCNTIW